MYIYICIINIDPICFLSSMDPKKPRGFNKIKARIFRLRNHRPSDILKHSFQSESQGRKQPRSGRLGPDPSTWSFSFWKSRLPESHVKFRCVWLQFFGVFPAANDTTSGALPFHDPTSHDRSASQRRSHGGAWGCPTFPAARWWRGWDDAPGIKSGNGKSIWKPNVSMEVYN